MEMDEPIGNQGYSQMSAEEVPSKAKQEWIKWIKNYKFIFQLIGILLFIYLVDVYASGGQSSLKEPMFDLVKTIALTVSGYIFAKSTD